MASRAATRVTTSYAAVRDRVAAACRRAGRAADTVRLVAVSKGMTAKALRAAANEGARDFGENYVQEWQAKRDAIADVAAVSWHFIGRIQRNKAAAIAEFGLVHSVADVRAARVLDVAAERRGAPLCVLLQVNLAAESTKGGVAAADLPSLLDSARRLSWVRVLGLMTIPPPFAPEAVRPLFAALRTLRDRQEEPQGLPELSMGMSADFEVAIEEGATLVRVGTAIFGPRKEVT
ncbi:MAG: YggS family pyridoxal phosphate-dependent enzyme [Deltaproteobacteria bacterium]|nr:YggS family pyridoxal phosphate-dependent enzyme [Deltaproteobacteria bacterium]